MPEPKNVVTTSFFKGYSNSSCEFYPCHKGIKHKKKGGKEEQAEFNCLFCQGYCPLAFLQCPGPYKVFKDKHGMPRKDCSDCTLNHDGYEQSWNFIQRWLMHPEQWDSSEQTPEKIRFYSKLVRQYND